eukprot:TRINITY_DN9053_c0_g1_i54.p1 TRINITY_DN9053_c0_g1~~TRINITY_DN9053_c0_g1_i54.p1  ORF type:complete len:559 (-),score=100.96 TRINITY_DN9053_c0_g1_i54:462-2138(-)
MPHFSQPCHYFRDSVMFIDAASRQSLELVSGVGGKQSNSVMSAIDRTLTGAGGRLLASRLNSPSMSVTELCSRLDLVDFFFNNPDLMNKVRKILQTCHDIERCMQRLRLGRGGPRDLVCIATTIENILELSNVIEKFLQVNNVHERGKKESRNSPSGTKSTPIPESLLKLLSSTRIQIPVMSEISRAFKQDLPISQNEGNFIADGYSEQLDELRQLRNHGKEKIHALFESYKEKYRLPLRLKETKTQGFFFEINSSQYSNVLEHKIFIHQQTKKSGICYKTQQLGELESKIANSHLSSVGLEMSIFMNLSNQLLDHCDSIKILAFVMASIDLTSCLALNARERNYVRPNIDNSLSFEVKDGRHVTVELSQSEVPFVSNDCYLQADKGSSIWLITGANMGGKSTFLRQNALIAILAQMGSYVPATCARIGIIDAVFSRVGASDDISKNRSTFMVEMLETSGILKNATHRSLIIMDEIGRGTATLDGLSIAWAVIEYLHHTKRSRTLFATHFHELTKLQESLSRMKCYHMAVNEENKFPIFIHRVWMVFLEKVLCSIFPP